MQQGLLAHMVSNAPICSLTRYIQSFSSHSYSLLRYCRILHFSSAATEEMENHLLRAQKLLQLKAEIKLCQTEYKQKLLWCQDKASNNTDWHLRPLSLSPVCMFAKPKTIKIQPSTPMHIQEMSSFSCMLLQLLVPSSAVEYKTWAHGVKFDCYTGFTTASLTIIRELKSKTGKIFFDEGSKQGAFWVCLR